ncbi:MAG: exonuclease [Alphaproteobacteria bacterium]|nr:exonuclease [Alphaproteobacteria bacterium]
MLERLSLRVRFLLFFGLIAAAIPAVIAVSLYLAALRMEDDPTPQLVLFGGVASFALVGIVGWVAQQFDTHVAQPIVAVARDLQTRMHANPGNDLQQDEARYLGILGPTIREASDAMRTLRENVDAKVEAATQSLDRQRLRLETVLRDLNEGVIVCNLDHQVLLYNRQALKSLYFSGDLGLGRSIFTVVNRPPFLNTLERLTNRFTSGRYKSHPDYLHAPFVFSTPDGRHVLQGKMSLVVDEDKDEAQSYVLTFSDATKSMSTLAERDGILGTVVEDFRRPLAALRMGAELLSDTKPVAEDVRAKLEDIIVEESKILSDRLEEVTRRYQAIATSAWPMSDINSANLLSVLARRYREHPVLRCDVSGEAQWLHCDSNTIIELMDRLVRHVLEETGAQVFSVEAAVGKTRRYLDIIWSGDPIRDSTLCGWLEEEIEHGAGRMTGNEILRHHGCDAWCEQMPDGRVRLRLPMPDPVAEHSAQTSGAPPVRLEFYDFDLLQRGAPTGDLAQRRLRDLTYVVFDTETTGLEPSNGDEMISIAGVRIVNGRVLTGESFDRLINPGRSIPKSSTLVHHISEDMVADQPPVEEILPRFRDYVGDAVLVAHNAAFDLRFIELKQDRTGVRLDNPVLDTVLLSAIVHDHTDQHTLDAVAERFSIEIPEETRHTALGDSLATAYVFLKMVDLLEANGISTLGEALAASEKLVQIRRAQSRY